MKIATRAAAAKDYDERKQQEMGAVIEKREILDLQMLRIEETLEWRCGSVE